MQIGDQSPSQPYISYSKPSGMPQQQQQFQEQHQPTSCKQDTCSVVETGLAGHIRTGECCVDVIVNLPSRVRYLYDEPIGKGGGGSIYLVKYNGAQYALKISHKGDDSQVKVECEVLPYLCHPNIIRCAAVDIDSHSFLMQFADRNTLANFISAMHARHPTLPGLLTSGMYVRLLVLLAQVAKGLQYLHSQHCVHRDLNPRNVLLCSKEGYKLGYMAVLSDFGACYMEGNEISAVNSVKQLGTPQYAAPEQLEMQNVKEIIYQSDIYSYGVLVWSAMSGLEPWDQLKNAQEVVGYVVGQQQALLISPKWPKAIQEIIRGCFSRDPSKRPTWDRILQLLKEENENIARIKKLPEQQQILLLSGPQEQEVVTQISKRQLLSSGDSFRSQQSNEGSTASSEPQPSPFADKPSSEETEEIVLQQSQQQLYQLQQKQQQQSQKQQQHGQIEWQQSSSSSQIHGRIENYEEKGEEEREKENVEPSSQGVESTTVGIPVDASNQCNFKKIWQQQEKWCQDRRGQNQSSKIKHFFNALVNSGIEGLSGSRRQLLDTNQPQKRGEVVDIESRGANMQEMQTDLDASPHWRCVRLGCKIGWYAGLGVAGVLFIFVLICLLF